MSSSELMLLTAVLLPPRALDELGLLVVERTARTTFGDVGPIALRRATDGASLWVAPYSGLPSRTDPRATLIAAQSLGVRRILTWDVGIGVNHVFQRGQTAIATDLIDWTHHQPDTFHTSPEGESLPSPSEEEATFCPECMQVLHAAYPTAPPAVIAGVDGPRRETPAEARMFRNWGADLVCHNISPEASLARELGLCFAALVTVGNYSRDQVRPVREGEVRRGLEFTMQRLPEVLRRLAEPRNCRCGG